MTQQLESRMESYRFGMKEEALLEEIGFYSQSIEHVDQKLLTSPITRMQKGQAISE
ncbi:hypothetical protein [Pectobacterium versatile]|uniref:hypothetical protein n=1 Tax=Pectobacterium versatile TaxID=2488639 RepID=UPI001F3C69C1|nr:hypothetical protein [Pectobacterium versatile]